MLFYGKGLVNLLDLRKLYFEVGIFGNNVNSSLE